MTTVGLRIDIDTLRGTRIGVPNLIGLFARHHIHASFFFSMGPDNMGRHLWRLMRPAFLKKMFRTKAASLYGLSILRCGTIGPGPVIGKRCPQLIRKAAEAGHEVGLHAWDHYSWQTKVAKMDHSALIHEIRKGYDLLAGALGRQPDCFAAPAWRITPDALRALDDFQFRFTSDCRGHSIFHPIVDGLKSCPVQVPTTLPTFDELIGRTCTTETYNEYLLKMIRPQRLNILTIHAEAEGIHYFPLFEDFLKKARRLDIEFKPLGEILAQTPPEEITASAIRQSTLPGRDGWLAFQDKISGL